MKKKKIQTRASVGTASESADPINDDDLTTPNPGDSDASDTEDISEDEKMKDLEKNRYLNDNVSYIKLDPPCVSSKDLSLVHSCGTDKKDTNIKDNAHISDRSPSPEAVERQIPHVEKNDKNINLDNNLSVFGSIFERNLFESKKDILYHENRSKLLESQLADKNVIECDTLYEPKCIPLQTVPLTNSFKDLQTLNDTNSKDWLRYYGNGNSQSQFSQYSNMFKHENFESALDYSAEIGYTQGLTNLQDGSHNSIYNAPCRISSKSSISTIQCQYANNGFDALHLKDLPIRDSNTAALQHANSELGYISSPSYNTFVSDFERCPNVITSILEKRSPNDIQSDFRVCQFNDNFYHQGLNHPNTQTVIDAESLSKGYQTYSTLRSNECRSFPLTRLLDESFSSPIMEIPYGQCTERIPAWTPKDSTQIFAEPHTNYQSFYDYASMFSQACPVRENLRQNSMEAFSAAFPQSVQKLESTLKIA